MDWALPTIAIALLAYAAVSRRLEGTPITGPMVFTAIGLLVGRTRSGSSTRRVSSEAVKLLAEATLALVLFGDASRIDLRALRDEVSFPARLLGIGLPLTIVAGFGAALVLFGSLAWPEALLLAVILAPTDAALGQAVVTLPRLPSRVRQGLNVESGLNDGICVPLFFIVARDRAGGRRRRRATSRRFRLVVEEIGYGIVGGLVAGALAAAVVVVAGRRGLVDRTVAAGRPGRRRRARVQRRRRARRLRLHRRVRGRDGLRRAAPPPRRRGRLPARGARRRAQRDHLHRLRRGHARAGARRARPGDRRSTRSSASRSCGCSRSGSRCSAPAPAGQTVGFLGWFGPRGLASIVFAVILIEEGGLPHERLIVTTDRITVGLSVLLHGLTAAPLADRYAAWYESHPRDGRPTLESRGTTHVRWRTPPATPPPADPAESPRPAPRRPGRLPFRG